VAVEVIFACLVWVAVFGVVARADADLLVVVVVVVVVRLYLRVAAGCGTRRVRGGGVDFLVVVVVGLEVVSRGCVAEWCRRLLVGEVLQSSFHIFGKSRGGRAAFAGDVTSEST
jgi:hypothetical protein